MQILRMRMWQNIPSVLTRQHQKLFQIMFRTEKKKKDFIFSTTKLIKREIREQLFTSYLQVLSHINLSIELTLIGQPVLIGKKYKNAMAITAIKKIATNLNLL